MRKFLYLLIPFVGLLVSAGMLQAGNYSSIIVKLKDSKSASSLQKEGIALQECFDITVSEHLRASKLENTFVVRLPESGSTTEFIEELRNRNDVEYVEPNYIYRIEQSSFDPDDPHYKKQWALDMINAPAAFEAATGKGIKVAVIDTGIEFEHEDFEGAIFINSEEDINGNGTFEPWPSDSIYEGISGDINGIDDDNNGYTDDICGYDFVDQRLQNYGDFSDRDFYPGDEHGHGTAVAGIIAARAENRKGIVGAAFDSKIIPIRAFDFTGAGESDDIAASIIYAASVGADVINMSFGELDDSRLVKNAVEFAYSRGCILVASAGNNNYNYKHYPSDYPEVISVANCNSEGERGGTSNYGSRVDLAAPGTRIRTCATGNSYDDFSGTSAAAPFVSSAAALLSEKYPDITPAEAKGIITGTCFDAGPSGFDDTFAAGILDMQKMLNFQGKSRIEIITPQNDMRISRELNSRIYLTGYAVHPLFDSLQIIEGAGRLPKRVRIHTVKKEQIIDDTLGYIDLDNMVDTLITRGVNNVPLDTLITRDTLFTVSLKVFLKNRKTLENRIYVDVFSDETKLDFSKISIKNVYRGGKREVLIAATTNRPALCRAEYYEISGGNTIIRNDNDFIIRQHEIILDDLKPGKDYTGRLFAYHPDFDTVSQKIEFTLEPTKYSENRFVYKRAIDSRLVLYSEAAEIEGKPTLFANSHRNLTIGEGEIYTFDNGKFIKTDSTVYSWIPAGTGDSDGDGKPELLTKLEGASVLFEKEPGESFYDKSIFHTDNYTIAWAEHLVDIDRDGRDEIITKDSNRLLIYDYRNGKYEKIDSTLLPERYRGIKLSVRSAVGDFDGDGKYEICAANLYGALFMFEYSDNGFSLEYSDTTLRQAAFQHLIDADIDGDGTPEVIHLTYESEDLYGLIDASNPVWVLRVLKSESENEYKEIAKEYFSGVRAGNAKGDVWYRNGIGAGDLTADGRAEIAVSVMPELYVLSYDDESKKLMPIWHYPQALSNTAVIYDFDDNGINEIGFSGFNATVFYEYIPEGEKPGTPVNIRARAFNADSAIVSWSKVADAEYYRIALVKGEYLEVFDKKIFADSTIFTRPDPDIAQYFVTVIAYNETYETPESEVEYPVELVYGNPISEVGLEVENTEPLLISLEFDGILGGNYLDPGYFVLIGDSLDESAMPYSAVVAGESGIMLRFSESFPAGQYSLNIKSFPDKSGIYSEILRSDFEIRYSEKNEEIFLTGLKVQGSVLVELFFSEPVDPLTASDIDNYIFKPFGEVIGAVTETADSNSVQVVLSYKLSENAARGVEYTITVKNIESVTGKKMTDGPGNTLGFTVSNPDNRGAYAYPQPVSISKNPTLTFAGLTEYAEIKIVSLPDGKIVDTMIENDGNGGYVWDCRDKNGNLVNPGIYLFKVKGRSTEGEEEYEEIKKFVIKP